MPHSTKLGRFYIGFTSDFDKRFDFHLNSDEKRKFTHNANDWITFLIIKCQSKSQELAIEKHIKKMKSKIYIQNLILCPEMIDKLLKEHLKS
ncbi:GIY-YIG nuclease family protein [Flavobacterium luteum]|uniref:GIY-YIG nuclease family protein n=1 Tax=Flavobacterium luteum TaxID=2026654 RepID=UPI001CDA069F|nr:GIY-YIG nuclease family protein [Flavobacterium luteum]